MPNRFIQTDAMKSPKDRSETKGPPAGALCLTCFIPDWVLIQLHSCEGPLAAKTGWKCSAEVVALDLKDLSIGNKTVS